MPLSLLCLSSGLTPQYRLDILRLLALPRGTYIQFRYGEDIIAKGLRGPLAENTLRNAKVLLAHVDCNPSARQTDGNCPIIPCRHSTLIGSRKVAEFYFLQFRLEEFAPCQDPTSFQNQLPMDRPHWTANSETVGTWCLESAVGEQTCKKVTQLEGWQNVIVLLAKSEDFVGEPFFFAVEGLYVRGDDTQPCNPVDGEFTLRSEHDHFVQLFHFHPDGDKHSMSAALGMIKMEVSQPQLEAVTSPTLPIASSYDLKRFHFRTAATTTSRFGSVVIRATQNSGEAIASQPELFIPIKIRLGWLRTIAVMIAIAVLLFAQQYLSATTKGSVSKGTVFGLALLAAVTALVAVLGLKKPV